LGELLIGAVVEMDQRAAVPLFIQGEPVVQVEQPKKDRAVVVERPYMVLVVAAVMLMEAQARQGQPIQELVEAAARWSGVRAAPAERVIFQLSG